MVHKSDIGGQLCTSLHDSSQRLFYTHCTNSDLFTQFKSKYPPWYSALIWLKFNMEKFNPTFSQVNPSLVYAVFLCDHTTGCEAYSFTTGGYVIFNTHTILGEGWKNYPSTCPARGSNPGSTTQLHPTSPPPPPPPPPLPLSQQIIKENHTVTLKLFSHSNSNFFSLKKTFIRPDSSTIKLRLMHLGQPVFCIITLPYQNILKFKDCSFSFKIFFFFFFLINQGR